MHQMRKCQNSRCGKYFEYNPAHPAKYCSKKCCREANNRKRKSRRKAAPESPPPCRNRPYTEDTVYLVHKWHREGMSIKQIASLLQRSAENIEAALERPLTRGQEKSIMKYLKR